MLHTHSAALLPIPAAQQHGAWLSLPIGSDNKLLTGRGGLTARLVLVSIVWQKLPRVTNSRSPSLVLRAPYEHHALGHIIRLVHPHPPNSGS